MARAAEVVWITGGSSGIGRALALNYAQRGAHVAISARREDRLAGVASEIEAAGGRALAVRCDVTDEGEIRAALDAIDGHFGGIDTAIANAGFAVRGTIEALSAADWRRQLEVNVVGAALTAKHAIPYLRHRAGRLALVGSVAAMVPAPGSSAYAASKAAVRAIGQSLSVELHGSGVSCTTIHPGFVESEIGQVDNLGVHHPEREDKRHQRLMWSSERAAAVMVDAIDRRVREHVFTAHGKVGGWLGRHAPQLLHFAMTRRQSR